MITSDKIERQLFSGEAKYQAVFRNSFDGILITTKDGKHLLDVNPSACRMFQRTEEEMLKCQRSELVDVDHANFKAYLKQRVDTGSSRGELILIRKDGERFPADVTSSSFLDASGQEKTSVFIRDISDRKKTIIALEKSERLYRNLFENMLNGFAYVQACTRNGKVLDVVFIAVNHEFERILGIKEATGKKLSELLPGLLESDAEYQKIIKRVVVNDERIKMETFLKTVGIWVSVSFYKTEKDHFVTLIDDISARKKADEEVQLNQIRLKRAQQIGKLGYWQQTFGEEILWASDEAMKIFGLPATGGEIHRSVLFPMVKNFEKVEQEAEYHYKNQLTYKAELMLLPADGSPEKIVSVIAEAFQTANDPKLKIIGIIQDITDEKKAEQKIVENERKLDVIYNTVSDIIFMLKVEAQNKYRFLSVNKTFTLATGLPESEVVGKCVDEIIPQPSLNLVLSKYAEAIDTRSTVSWVEETKYPSGNKFGFVTVSPVTEDDGICTMLVGSVHDITQRMEAENKLMTTNEELHRLSQHLQNVREEERLKIARDIHDELGQQLTGAKMELALLFKKLQFPEPSMQERADDVINLLDDSLRSVRRISSALRPGLLDELGLVAALDWHSEEVERRSGIRVQFSSNIKNPDLPLATATALFRIYQEALTNAMKHAHASKITSKLLLQKGRLLLTVKDDGTGIVPKKDKEKKTLGLVGIKERTFILGGLYELNSKPGKGTELKISIPYLNNV